jgi:hypothetical protein
VFSFSHLLEMLPCSNSGVAVSAKRKRQGWGVGRVMFWNREAMSNEGREPSSQVQNIARGEKSPQSEGIRKPIYTPMSRPRKPRL